MELRPCMRLTALLVILTGCGGSDFETATDAPDAAVDANAPDAAVDGSSKDAEVDGKDSDVPEATAEANVPDAPPDVGQCSSSTVVDPVAEADGIIVEGNCQGSLSFLFGPFANLGMGRALVRFKLDQPIAEAFVEGRVQSVSLEINRATSCDGQPCPNKPGSIAAFPLRSDWSEGTDAPYSGADWCRRLAGQPGPEWNAPGAEADHGNQVGEVAVSASSDKLTMELDPSVFNEQWVKQGELSVLLISDGATFVFVTREGTAWDAPRLLIQYCD